MLAFTFQMHVCKIHKTVPVVSCEVMLSCSDMISDMAFEQWSIRVWHLCGFQALQSEKAVNGLCVDT